MRLAEAKRTLSAVDYEAFKRARAELRHEAGRDELTRDKDQRLIRCRRCRANRDNVNNLPWVGCGRS